MSDQRRTDHSQSSSNALARPLPVGEGAASAGGKRRLLYYIGAAILAVLALAWIDGGEEPLHPISQAIELKSSGAESD